MLNILPGAKTYIIGWVMVLYGLVQFVLGDDPMAASQLILEGLGLVGLRKGIEATKRP